MNHGPNKSHGQLTEDKQKKSNQVTCHKLGLDETVQLRNLLPRRFRPPPSTNYTRSMVTVVEVVGL